MEKHYTYNSMTNMETPVPNDQNHTEENTFEPKDDVQNRLAFDEHTTEGNNDTSIPSLTSKNTKKATIYIEMEDHVNTSKLGKISDFKVVVKPRSSHNTMTHKVKKCTPKLSNICKKVFLFVIFTVYILFITLMSQKIVLQHISPKTEEVVQEESTHSPFAEKLQSERTGTLIDSGFHWASYYQDGDRFYKGIKQLPWQKEEDSGTGITLTDKDCFLIQRRSVYEVYSKVTFEYTRENTTVTGVHHNIMRIRNNEPLLLDKNVLSMPYRAPNTGRIFQPSSLIVVGEFLKGDVICVKVHNTSLVMAAKRDNSVKIIQKGY